MAYLPPGILEQTTIPAPFGADLRTGLSLIEEQWNRHFPALAYTTLLVDVTAIQGNDMNTLVGEPGSTKFDPLLGEAVPVAEGQTEWVQPHLSGTLDATQADVFASAVQVRARVRREATDDELKRWGWEKVRDLVVTIPVSLLDRLGVTCRPGDKLAWDGQEYTVLNVSQDGYWKNSNVKLFVNLNCETRRKGS